MGQISCNLDCGTDMIVRESAHEYRVSITRIIEKALDDWIDAGRPSPREDKEE